MEAESRLFTGIFRKTRGQFGNFEVELVGYLSRYQRLRDSAPDLRPSLYVIHPKHHISAAKIRSLDLSLNLEFTHIRYVNIYISGHCLQTVDATRRRQRAPHFRCHKKPQRCQEVGAGLPCSVPRAREG
ncbi:hypothetical protein NDU88_000833 [Pleurodeles waltl]|uniref:Uncharacterized protein n=1 Tax=Pleurodeles waltl TaxID=8319 RepID=A0AAV7U539_PLEWA|nr:hypothetical protein NDU88_000833 [Pleurodeles waltl]